MRVVNFDTCEIPYKGWRHGWRDSVLYASVMSHRQFLYDIFDISGFDTGSHGRNRVEKIRIHRNNINVSLKDGDGNE